MTKNIATFDSTESDARLAIIELMRAASTLLLDDRYLIRSYDDANDDLNALIALLDLALEMHNAPSHIAAINAEYAKAINDPDDSALYSASHLLPLDLAIFAPIAHIDFDEILDNLE